MKTKNKQKYSLIIVLTLIVLPFNNVIFGYIPDPPCSCSSPDPFSLSAPSDGEMISGTTVTLDWSHSSGANYYKVYLSTDADPTFKITTSSTSYDATSLTPGATYYWKITATHSCGTTCKGYRESPVWSFTVPSGSSPAAPTNLQAQSVTHNQINLSWTDNSSDEDGFIIERQVDGSGAWELVEDAVAADAVSYEDNNGGAGLNAATKYLYRICAFKGVSYSDFAETWEITPPSNLSATAGDTTIDLSWDASIWTNIAGYNIYQSEDQGSTYTKIEDKFTSNSYTVDNLTNEIQYDYYITAVDSSDNESIASNIDSATPTDLPPAHPEGLAAQAGDSHIQLNWNDNTEPDLAGYNVYRRQNTDNPYTKLNLYPVSVSEFRDYYVFNNQEYFYVIRAVDNTDNESDASSEVSATPSDQTPPFALANLTATAGDGMITLNWSDSTDVGFNHYQIYRSTDGGASYDPLVTSTESFYIDTGLTNGNTYYYYVTAIDNADNESANSNPVSAVPHDITAPSAPANVSAAFSGSAVNLDWDDNTETDLDSYRIYHSENSGSNFVLLDTLSGNPPASLYSDSIDPADLGKTYFYFITAVDAEGNESIFSNEVSATALASSVPASVTDLAALAADSDQIQLNWTGVTCEEYNIYRSTTGIDGLYSNIDTVTTNSYLDTELTEVSKYYYYVRAVNANGESGWSNEVSETTKPAAPTLTASAVSSSQIELLWTDNSQAESGYQLSRKAGSGNFNLIADLQPNTTIYQDNGLDSSVVYTYQVIAYAGSNKSVISQAVTSPKPSVPQNILTVSNDQSVTLDWDENPETDIAHYHIYCDTTEDFVPGAGNRISSDSAFSNYTHSPLTNGQTYYYVISAVDNAVVESDYSQVVSVTPDESDAPEPAQMGWICEPFACSGTSLYMIATQATDASGVEYCFEYTDLTTGTVVSIYQHSPELEIKGLYPSIQYEVKVKARDKSTKQNENDWSETITASTGQGNIHNLTQDLYYYNIQTAIDAATDGDIIELGKGVYRELIVLNGRNLFITGIDPFDWETVANTVIDGTNSGTVVTCKNSDHSTLQGITIKNSKLSGTAVDSSAVLCESSTETTIQKCLIENSLYGFTCMTNSSPMITLNIVRDNTYAISTDSSPVFKSNLIYDNTGDPAVAVTAGSAQFVNNTVAGNDGKGFSCSSGTSSIITNCIDYGNAQESVWNDAVVSYSCVQNQTLPPGTDNTNDSPQLTSEFLLGSSSPCINAGEPDYVAEECETDVDSEPRIKGGFVDMGACEFGRTIYVDTDATGNDDGSSWENAYVYLQDALIKANPVKGDDIWVAEGTYYPDKGDGRTEDSQTETFQLVSDVAVYGGFSGYGEAEEEYLCERNLKENKTILSGDITQTTPASIPSTSNSHHVVTGADNGVLDGFMITGGYASGTAGGGGMINDGVSPTVKNCHFFCNFATTALGGGGIYNTASGNSSVLVNCVFSENAVATFDTSSYTYGNGAGIYNNSALTLINCTLSNNLADTGAGIYNTSSGTLDIDNCILWNNRLDDGTVTEAAQIYNDGGTVTADYSCIQGLNTISGVGNIGNNPDTHYPRFTKPGKWEIVPFDDSIILQATVRDFRGKEEIASDDGTNRTYVPSPPQGHVDFENDEKNTDEEGIVSDNLDEITRKPVYAHGSEGSDSTNGPEEFYKWYHDWPDDGSQNSGSNMSATIPLELKHDGNGKYTFEDMTFYPIDNMLYGAIYGHSGMNFEEAADQEVGEWHNFHFTSELHCDLFYDPSGDTKFFSVNGSDDDMWIFINNKLVIDIGGCHSEEYRKLELDGVNAKVYRPQEGGEWSTCNPDSDQGCTWVQYGDTIEGLFVSGVTSYKFDLFHAERHTRGSHLRFSTSLELIPPSFEPGDYRLLSSSPCIDVGENSVVPAGILQDAYSQDRFFDDPASPDRSGTTPPVVDMGAYEYQLQVAPVANDDSYSVLNTEKLIKDEQNGVLANDTDNNGDELTAALVDNVTNGTLIFCDDGSFEYTPNSNYTGNDTFTYYASDGIQDSAVATVTIMVTGGSNHAPVAANDDYDLDPVSAIDLYVLANDEDQDIYDILTINQVTDPSHGTVDILNDGQTDYIQYDPIDNYIGPDSFTYQIEDNHGVLSNTATVTVDVVSTLKVFPGRYGPIKWPVNFVKLNGVVEGEPQTSVALEQWSVYHAEPGKMVDFDAGSDGIQDTCDIPDPTVYFSEEGTYVLKFTAYDGSSAVIDSGTATIDVLPDDYYSNDPPQITIHPYDSPVTTSDILELLASVTDDGLPNPPHKVTTLWSVAWQSNLRGNVTFDDPESVDTTVTFDAEGIYLLNLWADDSDKENNAQIEVIVKNGNAAPVVTGSIHNIDPQNENPVVFEVDETKITVTDDGLPTDTLTYEWKALSREQYIQYIDNTSANDQYPHFKLYKPGQYILILKASDGEKSGYGNIIVNLNEYASNPYSLTVEAGLDTGCIVKSGQVNLYEELNLYGKGSMIEDGQGSVDLTANAFGVWSSEGPGPVTFIVNGSYENVTTAFAIPGTYTIRLEVVDRMISAYDEVEIKVVPIAVLAGGEHHSLVIEDTKKPRIWAFGGNGTGQLGTDDKISKYWPARVLSGEQGESSYLAHPFLENISSLDAGWLHSIAVDNSGNVWTWGSNCYGELGIGTDGGNITNCCTDNDALTPVKVLKGDQVSSTDYLENIIHVSAGRSGEHSLAVEKTGHVWAWGRNNHGQLGNDSTTDENLPVQVVGPDIDGDGISDEVYLNNIIAVSGGADHSIALDHQGKVYQWGFGQLLMPELVLYGSSHLSNITSVFAGYYHNVAAEKIDRSNGYCRKPAV